MMNKHLFTKGGGTTPASYWCEMDRFLLNNFLQFLVFALAFSLPSMLAGQTFADEGCTVDGGPFPIDIPLEINPDDPDGPMIPPNCGSTFSTGQNAIALNKQNGNCCGIDVGPNTTCAVVQINLPDALLGACVEILADFNGSGVFADASCSMLDLSATGNSTTIQASSNTIELVYCKNGALKGDFQATIVPCIDLLTPTCPAGQTIDCLDDLPAIPDVFSANMGNNRGDGDLAAFMALGGTVPFSACAGEAALGPDDVYITASDAAPTGTACDGRTIVRTWTVALVPCGGDQCGDDPEADDVIEPLTCTQTFTIDPVAAPVIMGCPIAEPIEVSCGGTIANIIVDGDNCTAGATLSTDFNTTVVCGTTTTVSFSGTDDCNRTVSTSCQVVITPGPKPAFSCPALSVPCGGSLENIVVPADGCEQGYTVVFGAVPVSTCNATVDVPYTLTYTCGDEITGTCSVSVTPGPKPEFSCPSLSVPCGGSLSNIVVPADGCTQGYTVVFDAIPFSACNATVSVSYTLTYTCGEVVTGACPVDITKSAEAVLSCSTVPTPIVCTEVDGFDFPILTGAADGCTPGYSATVSTINPTLNCDGSGTLSIVYAGTDDCGDAVGITCEVAVVIDQMPTINCPDNTAFPVECADEINLPTITWTSSCGMGGTLAAPVPVIAGDPDCDGTTYTFTYTLTDGCEVMAADNCVLVYTISNDGPTIECGALPTTHVGCGTPLPGGQPTFTTSCDVGGTLSVAGPVVNDVPGCVGTTYTYTHTATDACGRTTSCPQVITVTDNDAPDLEDEPADIVVQCAADVPPPTALGVTDDCDISAPILPTEVITPGDCPNSFTITRTWAFTDACGNEVTATRIIVVDDTTPPALPTPPGAFSGVCSASIPPAVPLTAVDNCDGPITVNPTERVTVDPNCANAVSITRTWTFTDNCGNTASVSQTLNTVDNTPPAIDCSLFPSVTLPCDATELPAPIIVAAMDNCDGPIDATIAMNGDISDFSACPDDGSLNIARTYTYADDCGNTSVCTQTFLLAPEEVNFVPCNDGNPCTFNDQQGENCRGEVCVPCMGIEQCRPFWCDDGDPCTFNDRVMIGCSGEICEPCTGTMEVADKDGDGYRDCEDACPHDPNKGEPGACGCGNVDTDSDGDGTPDCLDDCPDNPYTDASGTCSSCDAPGIESVEIVNIRACSDNGTGDNPDDDYFYGDIEVVFNFPPKLGGIDISGPIELYYNFENGNTSNVVTIKNQRMAADGKPISITVAYRGNEECNACIHVGEAPPSCSVPPCIHPDYGNANDASDACVADITLTGISKCDDNNTGSYEGDDFVWADVTVHLNNAPSEGMLVVSGMARHHVDMAEVKGDSYTYYGAVNFNQANGWIVAEVMSHDAYADHVEPENMSVKDRLEYSYYGPDLGDCGFYKSVFECDPCTAGSHGNRLIGNTPSNLLLPNTFETQLEMVQMSLAPNPAKTEVQISDLLPALINSEVQLKVYDATGRIQMDRTINTTTGNFLLNINSIQDGIYLIYLENEGVIQTGRLMKF